MDFSDDAPTIVRSIDDGYESFFREYAGESRKRKGDTLKFVNMDGDLSDRERELVEGNKVRTRASAAEAQVISLRKQLIEQKIMADQREQKDSAKNEGLNKRISRLEAELKYVSEKERDATAAATEAQIKRANTMEEYEERMRISSEEKFNISNQLNQSDFESREQLEQIHSELIDEQKKNCELTFSVDKMNRELDILRNKNAQISEDLQQMRDDYHQMEQKALTCEHNLNDWMCNYGEAKTMVEEMKLIKNIKSDNERLKQLCIKYKSSSENTGVLKERNVDLQNKCDSYKNAYQQLCEENSALKLTISRINSEVQQEKNAPSRMTTVDDLSRELSKVMQLNEKLICENTQLKERNDSINTAYCDLDKRFEAERQAYAREVEELRSSIALANTNLQEKCSNELKLKSECNQMSKYVQNLESKVEDISLQLEKANMDLLVSKNRVLESEQELEVLKSSQKETAETPQPQTCSEYRILHMKCNPMSLAQEKYNKDLKNALEEIAELKLRLEEFEKSRTAKCSGNDKEEGGDITMRVQERAADKEWQKKYEELESKLAQSIREKQKINESHAQVGREYREMATFLTGYQLKMKPNNLYELKSIFETNPDKHFLFQKSGSGELDLLETEYTGEWLDFAETYLMTDHSIPAFLAATTLQLYTKDKETREGEQT